MNEVLPLIDDEEFFLLRFDDQSLNKFLTEFSPSCIDKHYDESCALGVCYQVYVQKQPNRNFEFDGRSIAGIGRWINCDNERRYNVYGLKIYLTTSDTAGEVWKKISSEINNILGEKDEAWESFKEKIAEHRRPGAKIILTELNRTNEMSQELKKVIAGRLNSWNESVEAIRNSKEEELQRDCVCLELKKNNNGEMYFDWQRYRNYQPRENGDDNKWKIYLKEEYRNHDKNHVIYFEKFDKVEDKNEDYAMLISNNKNEIKNSIRSKNKNGDIANENQNDTKKNESDINSKQNSLNEIKYEQQSMKKDKNKNQNIEKDNSIDDNNKNENINNGQSENGKGVELKIKDKNKSEIKYENPNNEQVTNFQRKPTVLWIILAIIFGPTIILLIIFGRLACQAYKFNCKLEESLSQTLENNHEENAQNDRNKTDDNQKSRTDEFNKRNPNQRNNLDEELNGV